MGTVIAARAGLEPGSPADPRLLAHTAKYYELRFEGVRGKDAAQVMSGGLELGCFDSDLMAIAVPGAYAAGEALDVDAACGGFNLHWAWASGMLAGRAAGEAVAALSAGERADARCPRKASGNDE